MVDKWLKGEIIGVIFHELRKVYDVVHRELLLKKLSYYNLSKPLEVGSCLTSQIDSNILLRENKHRIFKQ